MPDVSKDLSSVKKKMHFFYVLDTSGSMSGAPISALNSAMRETVDILKKVQEENRTSVDFNVSTLEFNSDARWTEPQPLDIDDFDWKDLEALGGTNLEMALDMLNKALTRSAGGRLDTEIGNKNPMIIFMSDGIPFDGWERALDELKKNHWYEPSIKVAFALGDEADSDVLKKVVGRDGAVIKTSDLQIFRDLIKIVSATGSRAGRVSKVNENASGQGNTGKEIVQQALENMKAQDPDLESKVTIEAAPDDGEEVNFSG